ncbi:Gfo/Idh/MocA family oxidoreductase [Streptomyces sp. DSM 44915]|uniref:Gfo/Idh/MocA family oxidoreductase n=1 Tax=Streptomyces chisholmiae TaxID=3075540 RepID=A0ABU2K1D4_9ACTN|nr:Gfo/Idh/MocA family oxidoreductase [Streptomyces sp. DSM 44915]MDT0270793.1 Gfo/Idh/MocA family oxidoreductase [Streptomyces sp. DSM 44915]
MTGQPPAPRRIGVAGLGVISRYYLAAVEASPDWRLAAVCDPRPEAAAELADQLPPGTEQHTDHRALLASGRLDALVVAAPNHAHAALARDAIAAGVPVCVEKPLALDPVEGREVAALAQAAEVPLFTAFHRRYNDQLAALAAGLPPGVPVRSLTVRYLERIEEHIGGDTWYLDPARCGGGCVADNGPNAFDLVRQLVGEVRVVEAAVARDARGLDRRATVELVAAAGAEARVELDWSYPGETKDIVVRLADGTEHHADLLAGHQGFKSSLWHEYRALLADFARVVDAGRPAHTDGLRALELVADAYAAERAGAPVGGPR